MSRDNGGRWRLIRRVIAAVATLFAGALLAIACGKKGDKVGASAEPEQAGSVRPIHDATFVGSASCASCHAEEAAEWHGSDHDLAMQPADAETVLGDFDDVTFTHFGIESKFWKKGDAFFVTTPNGDGVPTDYKIDYTFGHYPLQQYLNFPRGVTRL